jgi:hypothetical protein
MPHLYFALLTALLLAAALATIEDRTTRERLRAAARVLIGCAAATIGGGWLMRLIHG